MLLLIAALFAAEPEDIALRGVCDGSAVVRAPNAMLLVAYDEDQSLHLFGIRGGPVLGSRSLAGPLHLEGDRELDLEAAASDGRTAWWVGSHGNNKDGKERPNRRVLFATNLPTQPDLSDLKLLRGPVDLLPMLKSAMPGVLTQEVLARPPKEGGLNIEGMALRGTELIIGLRSPLTEQGHAHIVVASVGTAGKVTIERTQTVDLGGRGVRSMEWTGRDFVVVAGPTGTKQDFHLYRWDGMGTPREIEAPLKGLNVEGLVAVEPGRWLVTSDDGAIERVDWKAKKGERECKEIRAENPQGAFHPSVYSRGRLFSLPEAE